MNIIQKIIGKLAALFKRDTEYITEHGNILIENQSKETAFNLHQPANFTALHNDSVSVRHCPKMYLRIEHLAKHARKRRVRKKNRHRLSKYESRRQ